MSGFTEIKFSITKAERELKEFKTLLESKGELSERDDILKRLPHWQSMLCGLGPLEPRVGMPDGMATEFDIGGRFQCDLVLGHSKRLHYLYVEFEGAGPTSVFKPVAKRRSKRLGDAFNAGLGQVPEWFWWNSMAPNADIIQKEFRGRYAANAGLLVLGQRHTSHTAYRGSPIGSSKKSKTRFCMWVREVEYRLISKRTPVVRLQVQSRLVESCGSRCAS